MTRKKDTMATNRMFLLHVPSGNAVYLGKRMGWGWHNVPEDVNKSIEKLFELVESSYDQDHFALAMEDCENNPYCFSKWSYSGFGHEDEPRVLQFDTEEKTETIT